MENQGPKQAKKHKRTSEPVAVLFGLIQSLLQNPAIHPLNGHSAIVNMAKQMYKEMADQEIIPPLMAPDCPPKF